MENSFIEFFNHPFFIIVGGLTTIIMMMGFCCTLFLIVKGIIPVWYRLGMGLSKRRIAVFALEDYDSLKKMLVDSKLFKEKNILKIGGGDIKAAENESLLLVHWKDFNDKLDEIIHIKKDAAGLIIYAPPSVGRIDDQNMAKINDLRNVILVNFKGRFLNDVLTTLITTTFGSR